MYYSILLGLHGIYTLGVCLRDYTLLHLSLWVAFQLPLRTTSPEPTYRLSPRGQGLPMLPAALGGSLSGPGGLNGATLSQGPLRNNCSPQGSGLPRLDVLLLSLDSSLCGARRPLEALPPPRSPPGSSTGVLGGLGTAITFEGLNGQWLLHHS